jgi:SAM-dependent methyltransferase
MDEEYGRSYERLYREHWWWRARERLIVRELRRCIGGRSHARILDVGCGSGLLFPRLVDLGSVEGLEAEPALAIADARWRDAITVGGLDETYGRSSSFDLVLMADVLEHIEDDQSALRNAHRVLTAGGFLVVTVPAFSWLWTRHDVLNRHFRRYTMPELAAKVEVAGFNLVSQRYVFQSLVIAKLAVRTWEALHTGRPRVPRLGSPWSNRILAQACAIEERLLSGWCRFGSSGLLVARKP